MAPIPDSVDDRLKDVIQHLYEIQSSVHGYLGPETQQELIRKIHQLTSSLSALSSASRSLPTNVPPEIIEYIDSGRNPDIYNRELVEAVQKGNMFLRGKSEAFAGLRDALGEEIVAWRPELEGRVRALVGVGGGGAVGGVREGGREKVNGVVVGGGER